MRVCRIILLIGAITLFSQLIPALAHAALVRAEPAPDAVLDHAPIEIRTWFSSPLIAGSRLKVFDSQFRAAAIGPTVIDSADPTLMHAPIEALQPGRYTVNWEATADDGHVSLGSYEFV